jgi:hypothetical protein
MSNKNKLSSTKVNNLLNIPLNIVKDSPNITIHNNTLNIPLGIVHVNPSFTISSIHDNTDIIQNPSTTIVNNNNNTNNMSFNNNSNNSNNNIDSNNQNINRYFILQRLSNTSNYIHNFQSCALEKLMFNGTPTINGVTTGVNVPPTINGVNVPPINTITSHSPSISSSNDYDEDFDSDDNYVDDFESNNEDSISTNYDDDFESLVELDSFKETAINNFYEIEINPETLLDTFINIAIQEFRKIYINIGVNTFVPNAIITKTAIKVSELNNFSECSIRNIGYMIVEQDLNAFIEYSINELHDINDSVTESLNYNKEIDTYLNYEDEDIQNLLSQIEKDFKELSTEFNSYDKLQDYASENIQINIGNTKNEFNNKETKFNEDVIIYKTSNEEYKNQTQVRTGGALTVEQNNRLQYLKGLYEQKQITDNEFKTRLITLHTEILEEIKNIHNINVGLQTKLLGEFQNIAIEEFRYICENPIERYLNGFLNVAINNLSNIDQAIINKVITENITHFENVAIREFTSLLNIGFLHKIAENIFEIFTILKIKFWLTDTINASTNTINIIQKRFIDKVTKNFGVNFNSETDIIKTKIRIIGIERERTNDDNTFNKKIQIYLNNNKKDETLKKELITRIEDIIKKNIPQSINNYKKEQFDGFERFSIRQLDEVSNYQKNVNQTITNTGILIDNFQKIAITKLKGARDYDSLLNIKESFVSDPSETKQKEEKKITDAKTKDINNFNIISVKNLENVNTSIENEKKKQENLKQTKIKEDKTLIDNFQKIAIKRIRGSDASTFEIFGHPFNYNDYTNVKKASENRQKIIEAKTNDVNNFQNIAINNIIGSDASTLKSKPHNYNDYKTLTEKLEKKISKQLALVKNSQEKQGEKLALYKRNKYRVKKMNKINEEAEDEEDEEDEDGNDKPEEKSDDDYGYYEKSDEEKEDETEDADKRFTGGQGLDESNSENLQFLYTQSVNLLNEVKDEYKKFFYLPEDIEKNYKKILNFYNEYKKYFPNTEKLFNTYKEKIDKTINKTESSFGFGLFTGGSNNEYLQILFKELVNNETIMVKYKYPNQYFFMNYNYTNGIKIRRYLTNMFLPRKINFNQAILDAKGGTAITKYPDNYLNKMKEIINKLELKKEKEDNDTFFQQVAIKQIGDVNNTIQEQGNLNGFIDTSIENISDITDIPKYLTKQNIDEFIRIAISIFQSMPGLGGTTSATTASTTTASATKGLAPALVPGALVPGALVPGALVPGSDIPVPGLLQIRNIQMLGDNTVEKIPIDVDFNEDGDIIVEVDSVQVLPPPISV